jgi:hypothetical protein
MQGEVFYFIHLAIKQVDGIGQQSEVSGRRVAEGNKQSAISGQR